jgi:hypothetical protein
MKRSALFALLIVVATACTYSVEPQVDELLITEAMVAGASSRGMIIRSFPSEDPGAPFYARVGPLLNQFFVADGYLVIPFYRDPACIPGGFDLLQIFDPPTGPDDLGAFTCSLTVWGRFLTEANNPPGTFPRLVNTWGSNVPFYIVSWELFHQTMEQGPVTMADLNAMNPMVATATAFSETLRPRIGEHLVVINAQGTLTDGRAFSFHVTHVEDQTKSISLKIP